MSWMSQEKLSYKHNNDKVYKKLNNINYGNPIHRRTFYIEGN
jgi:hypothetical protein